MDRQGLARIPKLQSADNRLRGTTVVQQLRGGEENKETQAKHNAISMVKVNTCKKEDKTCLWLVQREVHENILNEGDLSKATNMRLRLG